MKTRGLCSRHWHDVIGTNGEEGLPAGHKNKQGMRIRCVIDKEVASFVVVKLAQPAAGRRGH